MKRIVSSMLGAVIATGLWSGSVQALQSSRAEGEKVDLSKQPGFVLEGDMVRVRHVSAQSEEANIYEQFFTTYYENLFFMLGKSFVVTAEAEDIHLDKFSSSYLEASKSKFLNGRSGKLVGTGYFNWNREVNGKVLPFVRVYSELPLCLTKQSFDAWQLHDLEVQFVKSPGSADITVYDEQKLSGFFWGVIGLNATYHLCDFDSKNCISKSSVEVNTGYFESRKDMAGFLATLTHENGHALGLNHSPNSRDNLFYAENSHVVENPNGFGFAQNMPTYRDVHTMNELYAQKSVVYPTLPPIDNSEILQFDQASCPK